MEILFNITKGVWRESFWLLNRMAPYILFGFLFAGIIHIFLSPEKIAKHLGKGNFFSVIKASLFGIPLPLCSCGVIPAALALRREGASIGAVLAFLISTPTTGIDSIFATYSLIGGVFTAYRIAASFATGVLAGVLANMFIKEPAAGRPHPTPAEECGHCKEQASISIFKKCAEAIRYAFVELFDDVAKWVLIGVAAGGAISFFVPAEFLGSSTIGSGWPAYIVMFLIGAPMYVCATGSIPIATSLMLKGLSPGAAFVFLVSGPATNTVNIAVMARELGKKAIAVYLVSIFMGSVVLGYILDRLWGEVLKSNIQDHIMTHGKMMPHSIELGSSIILLALIFSSMYRTSRKTS